MLFVGIFVYDLNGNLQMTLTRDGYSLGSITYIAETGSGFIGMDGDLEQVVLWAKDGTHIGAVDAGDLFRTNSPWICDGAKLDDGNILVIMTDDRADGSAKELIAFKISGF